jgi:polyhydroxyalkanoate synthase
MDYQPPPYPNSSEDSPAPKHDFLDDFSKAWEHALTLYSQSFEEGAGLTALAGFNHASRLFSRLTEYWVIDPKRALQAQADFMNPLFDLWKTALSPIEDNPFPPIFPYPSSADSLAEWGKHPAIAFITQSVKIFEHTLQHLIETTDTFDIHAKEGARFYIKQLTAFFNPHVLASLNASFIPQTLQEGGLNILRGLFMLAQDIIAGKGLLKVRHTDNHAFKIGENLAATPGHVIFRNELIELIEYIPTTPTVFQTPLLIIPPWINKYYILDLSPEKSFIAWMVSQGIHVFCISWVNPNEHHAHLTFNDYRTLGIGAALDQVERITQQSSIATLGHCIGGTLLSMDLALRNAQGDHRIAHATLLTAQIDFSHAGELNVFARDDYLEAIKTTMAKKGYLDDSSLAFIFNTLRPDDLIWPYIIDVYLCGKPPKPFDVLYWNGDSTRIPAPVHSFYLQECYGNNAFTQCNLYLNGHHVNPQAISIPIYSLAALEDHIAPAYSIFLGMQHLKAPVTFVASTSGHIGGVINPPLRHKNAYYVSQDPPENMNEEAFLSWMKTMPRHEGSWWPHWRQWYEKNSPTRIETQHVLEYPRTPLGDAPGDYIHVRYET